MKKKEILKEESKKNAPARDVDEYLATVPKKARPALENLRNMIKSAAPMAEEIISYHQLTNITAIGSLCGALKLLQFNCG